MRLTYSESQISVTQKCFEKKSPTRIARDAICLKIPTIFSRNKDPTTTIKENKFCHLQETISPENLLIQIVSVLSASLIQNEKSSNFGYHTHKKKEIKNTKKLKIMKFKYPVCGYKM